MEMTRRILVRGIDRTAEGAMRRASWWGIADCESAVQKRCEWGEAGEGLIPVPSRPCCCLK